MDIEKILIKIYCLFIFNRKSRKEIRSTLIHNMDEKRLKRGYKSIIFFNAKKIFKKIPVTNSNIYRKYYDEQRKNQDDSRSFLYKDKLKTAVIGNRKIKSIAFYLPQMHSIPENDSWWGGGFTEWRNVARGMPSYLGHYQPRCPGELGYYDLSNIETIKRQVDLANIYGLDAFCFYYYWFAGKRLLEKPLNAFLYAKDLNLEFCICWANENWTRTWDGLEHDILIEQNHSTTDSVAVFNDWVPYFKDERYIRINDCPLLLIYRPALIPDFSKMTLIWREMAKKAGFRGLHIIAPYTKANKAIENNLDAYYEFPPQNISPYLSTKNHKYQWLDGYAKSKLYLYSDALSVAKKMHKEKILPLPLYPGAMPGWDNEARRPRRGHIYEGASPLLFREWLKSAYAKADKHPQEGLVFINAWNEWGEGAYLEPDLRYGYANLEALRSVVEEYSEKI